jgi:hypothetical protein
MEIAKLLSDLGVRDESAGEALSLGWNASMASWPGRQLPFLDHAALREWRIYGDIDSTVDADLARVAHRVGSDEVLSRFAWHAHRLLFETPDYNGFGVWPSLETRLAEDAGLFYLCLILELVPRIRSTHAARRVDERITRDTCQDLRIAVRRYRDLKGRPGVEPWLLGWYRLLASGDLYRLGRIQYVLRPFRGRVEVFRHRSTRRTVALAAHGTSFTSDGYLDSASKAPRDPGERTARFECDGHTILGTPIDPRGHAEAGEIELPCSEWRSVLRPGDTVMEMHIPERDPYTLEGWGDSMRQAAAFFPRMHPEQPVTAFGCSSWLLSPQLEALLGESSNLARFVREPYLFPIPSSGRDGLFFMFGTREVDLATAPRDTRLRRAVLGLLDAGMPFRGGGMFYLTEDLHHFGTAWYRRQYRN